MRFHRTAVIAVAAALAASGCKSDGETKLDEPLGPFEAEKPSKAADLRTQLVGFADYFSSKVAATADEIATSTTDREIRELTVRWKLRVIPPMQAAILVADPRAALLDAWVLCAQMEEYLSGGAGATEFGEHQSRAVETARQLEQRITGIAEGLLTPEQLAAVTRDIDELVTGNPIRGRFAVDLIRASQDVASSRGEGLSTLLSLPLGGVRESAEAIDRVARVTEVLTEVLEDLPERTRWQTELLMLEMEQLESVETALEELDALSAGIEAISDVADTLPTELHDQLADLLAQSDESQDKLQDSLDQARAMIEELRGALDDSKDIVAQVQGATASFNQAAESWGATAETVKEVVDTVRAMSEREPDPDSKPFDVNEYTAAASGIRDAAAEVQKLLAQIEARPAQAGFDHLADEIDGAIDRLIMGGLILIGAALLAAVIYRVVARLIKPGGQPGAIVR